MSDKQQTAVEFIQKQLRKYVRYDNRNAVETFDKIFEIAKEIHKEQALKFALYYTYGQYNVPEGTAMNIEKLYNEVYGGDEQ